MTGADTVLSAHDKFVDNWKDQQLIRSNTPSRKDGISLEQEKLYRFRTAWFIEELGREMLISRTIVSMAIAYFQRFYLFQSFKQHNRFDMSVTCVFLASKVGEKLKLLRDVIPAYVNVRKKYPNNLTESDIKELPQKILIAERILLHTLCFDLQVALPYEPLLDKFRALRPLIPVDMRDDMHQSAVNFVNDSFRTIIILQFPPALIAHASLLLALFQLDIKPVVASTKAASETTWLELIATDNDVESLKNIATKILSLVDSAEADKQKPGTSMKFQQIRNKMMSGDAAIFYNYPSPTGVNINTPENNQPAVSIDETNVELNKTKNIYEKSSEIGNHNAVQGTNAQGDKKEAPAPDETPAFVPAPDETPAFVPAPDETPAFVPAPDETPAFVPAPDETPAFVPAPDETPAFVPAPDETPAFVPAPDDDNEYSDPQLKRIKLE